MNKTNQSITWIYPGTSWGGTGAGGGSREHRRDFVGLPHTGVKLKFAIRDHHGRRRIKTQDDQYFALERRPKLFFPRNED